MALLGEIITEEEGAGGSCKLREIGEITFTLHTKSGTSLGLTGQSHQLIVRFVGNNYSVNNHRVSLYFTRNLNN